MRMDTGEAASLPELAGVATDPNGLMQVFCTALVRLYKWVTRSSMSWNPDGFPPHWPVPIDAAAAMPRELAYGFGDARLDQRILGALASDAAAVAVEFDDARSCRTSALFTLMEQLAGSVGVDRRRLADGCPDDPARVRQCRAEVRVGSVGGSDPPAPAD